MNFAFSLRESLPFLGFMSPKESSPGAERNEKSCQEKLTIKISSLAFQQPVSTGVKKVVGGVKTFSFSGRVYPSLPGCFQGKVPTV